MECKRSKQRNEKLKQENKRTWKWKKKKKKMRRGAKINQLDQKFFGTENRIEGNSFYFVYGER